LFPPTASPRVALTPRGKRPAANALPSRNQRPCPHTEPRLCVPPARPFMRVMLSKSSIFGEMCFNFPDPHQSRPSIGRASFFGGSRTTPRDFLTPDWVRSDKSDAFLGDEESDRTVIAMATAQSTSQPSIARTTKLASVVSTSSTVLIERFTDILEVAAPNNKDKYITAAETYQIDVHTAAMVHAIHLGKR
jgi:hypothetical protein